MIGQLAPHVPEWVSWRYSFRSISAIKRDFFHITRPTRRSRVLSHDRIKGGAIATEVELCTIALAIHPDNTPVDRSHRSTAPLQLTSARRRTAPKSDNGRSLGGRIATLSRSCSQCDNTKTHSDVTFLKTAASRSWHRHLIPSLVIYTLVAVYPSLSLP